MTDWPELRARIELIHSSLVQSLQASCPSLWSRSEAWANDVFPLSSTLTLNLTGGDREEDVVLAARFLSAPEGIDFDTDISREDGRLLAQGPKAFRPKASKTTQFAWGSLRLDSYNDFLMSKLGLIRIELGKLNSDASREV